MTGHYDPQLIDGWKFDEVASALQKCIRRGLEYDACFFAFIVHKSGFGLYLWRRLAIICSEDIGNGNEQATLVLSSLRDSWLEHHKNDKEPTLDKFLFIVHAVIFLCRSKKTRENDNLANLIDENYKNYKRLPIPEFCIDPHTNEGKKVWGRFGDLADGLEATRIRLWKKEWSHLDKLAYPDPWEKEILDIWLKRAKDNK